MYFTLAWRNIWRNKRRTWITLGAIAFAVFFSSLTQSLQYGSYDSMVHNSVSFYSGYAQIHKSGYWDEKSLDNSMQENENLIDKIEELPGVVNAIPRIENYSLISHGEKTKAAMVVGISPVDEDRLTGVSGKITKGDYLDENDQEILVGKGLAEYLGISPGDTVSMIGQGYHGMNAVGKYAVKGIFNSPLKAFSNSTLYMPLSLAQEYFGNLGLVSNYTLNVREGADLKELKMEVNTLMSDTSLSIMDWQEMMPEMVQQIELDQSSGKIILLVLYLIIGFGMFGTFLMMAKERTYEFGILIALGMRRIRLQILTIIELIILNLSGVILGVILSLPVIISLFYNPIPLSGDMAEVYEKFGMEPLLKFSVSPGIFIEQAVVVLVISALIMIYPIWFIKKIIVPRAIRD